MVWSPVGYVSLPVEQRPDDVAEGLETEGVPITPLTAAAQVQ